MGGVFRKIYCLVALVLAAFVSAEAYTITYNLNGGVNHPDNPTSYEGYLGDVTFYEPTREGHVFKGWYYEVNEYRIMPVDYYSRYKQTMWSPGSLGNITLFAMWEPVPQTPQQDERGCYLIHNAAELYGILSVSKKNQLEDFTNPLDSNYGVWSDYFFDGCISLQNDIVVNRNLLDKDGKVALDTLVWWPTFGFSGTFEGNGFKISGLRAENGLFSAVGESKNYAGKKTNVVSDLGVVDSYFAESEAGGIAGAVYSPAKLINVYSDAVVYGSIYGGGIVGEVNSTSVAQTDSSPNLVEIVNAYSLGHVRGDYSVGGIVGSMNNVLVRNVYFAGTLDGNERNCVAHYGVDSHVTIENSFCVETDKSNLRGGSIVSQKQFADGTVFDSLSKGVDGGSWAQEIGKDPYPVLKVGGSSFQNVLDGGENREKNPSVFQVGDAAIELKGNRVSLSGLVAGRALLVMDLQGRILHRLATEPSMVVELPKSGRFFIRYGNATWAVTIR